FLWLLEAWRHLQESKDILSEAERADDEADGRLRLGLAMRRLPRIAALFHHETLVDPTISQGGRFAVTVGRDGLVRRREMKTRYFVDRRLDGWPKVVVNAVAVSPDGRFVAVCTGDDDRPGRADLYD